MNYIRKIVSWIFIILFTPFIFFGKGVVILAVLAILALNSVFGLVITTIPGLLLELIQRIKEKKKLNSYKS